VKAKTKTAITMTASQDKLIPAKAAQRKPTRRIRRFARTAAAKKTNVGSTKYAATFQGEAQALVPYGHWLSALAGDITISIAAPTKNLDNRIMRPNVNDNRRLERAARKPSG
jgi:hypothetical protein